MAASMMETWSAGKWNLYRFKPDLYNGLANLVDVCREQAGAACGLRYEDLVADPEAQARRLFAYLDLPYEPGSTSAFKDVRLDGRMGDPTGIRSYAEISAEPLDKWRRTICNPLRKSWARRYVQWIGEARLAVMGYSIAEILDDLARTRTSVRRVGSDVVRMSVGPGGEALKPLWLSISSRRG